MSGEAPSDYGTEKPFLALFQNMVDEKGGWPSAPSDRGLGMRYTKIGDGVAIAEWEAKPDHCIPTGTVHGGHIAAVADSVCSLAAVSTLERRGMTAGTTTLQLEFYRYTYPAMLIYNAHVTHRSRRQIFVACEITDSDGRKIAHARATLAANEPRQAR